MIDERVPEALRTQLLGLPVDWRNAYFGPGPTAGTWRAYPESAAGAAGVAPLPAQGLGLVHTPLEPMRSRPAHAAELISELRMGEQFIHLGEHDGWWLVAGEDDYVGWVRAWTLVHVTPQLLEGLQARRLGRYALPLGSLELAGAPRGRVPVSLGLPLLAPTPTADGRERARPAGRIAVELVDGSTARLPPDAIDLERPSGSAQQAVQTAAGLVGCAYRWGGRSPAGLDCSGLVQLSFLLAGFSAPRDAAQLARWGVAVGLQPAAWEPGDVLCFGHPADHVALWDGEALLHARARVRRDPPSGVPDLMGRLTQVRRATPAQHLARPTLWGVLPASLPM